MALSGAETALALVLDVVHSADRFAGIGRAVGALALVAPVGVGRAQTVVRAGLRAAEIGVIWNEHIILNLILKERGLILFLTARRLGKNGNVLLSDAGRLFDVAGVPVADVVRAADDLVAVLVLARARVVARAEGLALGRQDVDHALGAEVAFQAETGVGEMICKRIKEESEMLGCQVGRDVRREKGGH